MPTQFEKSLQTSLAPSSVNQPRLTASRSFRWPRQISASALRSATYFEVDPESRVKEAHVNFRPVQNKPVTPFGRLPKLKEDHHPVIRQIFSPYQFVQNPHEEVGIKMLVAEIAA